MKKMLLLGFALFSLGSYLFGVALHNVDLAYNINNVPTCIDTSPFGNIQTKDQMYLSGLQGLIISYFLFFSSAIIFLYPKT